MSIIVIKSLLAVFLALGLFASARRAKASLRHLILAALFVFLLLLPLVQFSAPQGLAPRIVVPEQVARQGGIVQRVVDSAAIALPDANPAADSLPARPDAWLLVIVLYGTGVALLAGRAAVGVVQLRRLAARGTVWLEGTARMNVLAFEAGIRRAALVIESPEVEAPLTFGFTRSIIVVPPAAKSWPDAELASALRHELEHVRRGDWALQLLARLACALHWPNPLVWYSWRLFCLEAERACDDAVVRSGQAPEAYAGQLVSLARSVARRQQLPALAMASSSRLGARVKAILDPRQSRGPHGAYAGAVAAGITLLFLVAVAPARLIAEATESMIVEVSGEDSVTTLLGEALIRAAGAGDENAVRRVLATGVHVDTVVSGDGTALIAAARAGEARMVDYLLSLGADVNVASPGDGNPLIAAAKSGSTEITRVLLDRGAEIDTIVPGDENALMQASWGGHEAVVRLLLERGADPNLRSVEENRVRTALRLARQHGHARIVTLLIAAGARD